MGRPSRIHIRGKGCSNSRVSTFYATDYKNAGTISVVAAAAELNDSLEFRHYKARFEQSLAAHGYKIISNPADAEFIAVVAYGIDEGKSGVVTTPIYGLTGGGTTFTSLGTSSYTMPSYGAVASSTNSVTTYTEEFKELFEDWMSEM